MEKIFNELNFKNRIKARSKNLFFFITGKTNTTQYLPHLITKFYGNPSKKIELIGITGTNGKTTTAYLIYQALHHLGYKTGLIGSINISIGHKSYETKFTTPKPIVLSRFLKKMTKNNYQYCVMEVSSIGLIEHRVNGLKFSAGVFTNLTKDHMHYHKSMINYRYAKSLLFQKLSDEATAIINLDDPNWKYFIRSTNAKITSFGSIDSHDFSNNSFNNTSHVNFTISEYDFTGTVINLDGYKAKFNLIGRFNAYNVAAAYTTLISLGHDKEKVIAALSKTTAPPGRLEVINPDDAGKNPIIIIDYAHTPDSLEIFLKTLRNLLKDNNKLTTVFGCEGDRNKWKRTDMGKIASQYSDRIVLTSDHPRYEDPQSIINDILNGIDKSIPLYTETSRKKAIHKAILESSIDDVILIAGKGHETYQEINGVRNQFDDKKIALEALNIRLTKTKKQ